MVELTGIEPATLRVAPAGSFSPGALPPDPQLGRRFYGVPKLVELTGIEPATYGLQSRRSPS
jgi:hypothetical protein